jgi:predicted nucleic acid-binding protein
VLVDTSVWIDHFRRRNARLSDLLEAAQVWSHPFVIGELACGNVSRRAEVIGLLEALPRVPLVHHEEVLDFIAAQRLHGRGLGWVDMHVLACARLANLPLWTLDRRLASVAAELSLRPPPS